MNNPQQQQQQQQHQQQPPWQPQEKLELLTEVIRKSRVPPELLINFIQTNRIVPDWGNMILPQRRSMNQCNLIYDEMMRSGATVLARSTSVRELGAPSAGAKRPLLPDIANYGGRMIQPRPVGAPVASPNEPSEPPKKKRGRPTKAEAEERRQAAAARGEPYPSIRRGSAIATVAGPSSTHAARPPSVAAAQAALGVVPRSHRTPSPHARAPSSESSSGKRKRGRPARAEEEDRRAQERFGAARGPGPSRYPDILSRDDVPGSHQPRSGTPSTQPGPSEPPPR